MPAPASGQKRTLALKSNQEVTRVVPTTSGVSNHLLVSHGGWKQDSHVVLDEPLDLVAGVFVLAVSHRALFKLVAQSQRAEENDSAAEKQETSHRLLQQQQQLLNQEDMR